MEGFPWDDLRKIFTEGSQVAKVPNGIETLLKISIAWVGCTNVTDDRQTTDDRRQTDRQMTDRQMDGRRHIANMNMMSSRSLKMSKISFVVILLQYEFFVSLAIMQTENSKSCHFFEKGKEIRKSVLSDFGHCCPLGNCKISGQSVNQVVQRNGFRFLLHLP